MHAVHLMDGDIFADPKGLTAEMKPGFIGGGAGNVIVKAPAVGRSMHEVAELIVFARPLADDAARVAMGSPGLDIDPRCRVERGDDDIADRGRTLGVIVLGGRARAGPA
ncbi:hypothetical protein [Bradyrhizobium elkanii]|uniref:hypothetical protein n=1 Tax=Bradyrhizobium elkanii TaxID=29448 RepID=UPI00339AF057